MKIAYFDCSSGVAGNMILGALVDAGVEKDYLRNELLKIQETKNNNQINYKLQITNAKRNKIQTTFFDVKVKNDHVHRDLDDIKKIINRSKLSKPVKVLSIRIFERLALAEAKVHGVPIREVCFHEVGAIDAIVDIVGTAICLEKLGIEKVYASPLPFGKGSIKHGHGILPNPAPATAQLTKHIPTYGINVQGELVTPTGAAILTTIADSFESLPYLEVQTIGNGAGSKIFKGVPGFLRVFIGQADLPTEKDTILKIECNIDDMKEKILDQAIAKLMRAGALDAYISPIRMKKQRNAFKLTVLCEPMAKDQILDTIFGETTTFGVRIYAVAREKLSRKFIKAGSIKVKVGSLGKEIRTLAPEFEDIKSFAQKHDLPIKGAYRQVWKKIHPGKRFTGE